MDHLYIPTLDKYLKIYPGPKDINRYKKISSDKQVQTVYRFDKVVSVIGLVPGRKEIR